MKKSKEIATNIDNTINEIYLRKKHVQKCSDFLNVIEKVCNKNGLNPKYICRIIGISKSNFYLNNWDIIDE